MVPKLISIVIETAVIVLLVYICLMPITKKVNKIYFDSKLIRKLYMKMNKKSDDPLQTMLGAGNLRNKKETDPIFMKSIKFSLSDYFGPFIVSIKNLLRRKKLAELSTN